jgi:hypothetical protein
MKVHNVNGTRDTDCNCGSWLDHWRKFSRQAFLSFCPVDGCLRGDLVGVHVQKAELGDRNWYIVPLCAEHSQATGTINISDIYRLVSADVSETCGERSF